MKYGLIGHPLSHSYSGIIHKLIGRYQYDIVDLPDIEFDDFMTQRTFEGINVTIPYKQKVIPYCAKLSETAKRIGSVNTIIKQSDGSLYGDNTDYKGFLYMCEMADISLNDKNVVILGTGGTSLTAQTVTRDCGVNKLNIVSRNGEYNYNNLHLLVDSEVIINTTPVGMYPNCGVSPIDLNDFPNCKTVIDVIYNPLKTKLLLDAERCGMQYVNGLPMLVAQAVYAAELFLNEVLDKTIIETILSKLEHDMSNIVLVGMPGSGKTSIGKAIAEKLGREFYDTDEVIEQNESVSISDIIESKGEQAFRELENQTVTQLGKQNGLVISTGGGVVLRQDNRDMLRQNGYVVWIKRPLESLETVGRPLSKDIATLMEMYQKRQPLYQECSDLIVENIQTISDAVNVIIKKNCQ